MRAQHQWARSATIGQRVSEKDMRLLRLERDTFHGDWNYSLRPRRGDR